MDICRVKGKILGQPVPEFGTGQQENGLRGDLTLKWYNSKFHSTYKLCVSQSHLNSHSDPRKDLKTATIKESV